MATIVFFMLPAKGHINASLKIARELKSRGHVVYYASDAFYRDYIEAQGFPVVRIFNESSSSQQGYPGLSKARFIILLLATSLCGAAVRQKIEQVMYWAARFDSIPDEVDTIVESVRPELMVVDSFMPHFALAGHRHNVPFVLMSTTLPSRFDSTAPPLNSDHVPKNSVISRFRVRCLWSMFFLFRYLRRKALSLVTGIDGLRELRRLAVECDYPVEKIDTRTEYWEGLGALELFLCPKEFDLPRRSNDDLYYIEPAIDLERVVGTLTWDHLKGGRPLLYCSLGTASNLDEAKSRLILQSVIAAVSSKPDWLAIVVVGEHRTPSSFGSAPPNVLLVRSAPQVEVLERASLMVTHGGLNSIKECIFFGVPMIVFPFLRDQHGNAVRVKYHRLGVVGNLNNVSPQQIRKLIDAVEADPRIRQNVAAMSRLFRDQDATGKGGDVIEGILARWEAKIV